MNFQWHNRYSDTKKSDKFGRWARLCYYKKRLIAWVNRIEFENKFIYVAKDFFPSNANSNPCYVDKSFDFEEIKKGVEKRFTEFCDLIINNK